jgi:hypothetical protein
MKRPMILSHLNRKGSTIALHVSFNTIRRHEQRDYPH